MSDTNRPFLASADAVFVARRYPRFFSFIECLEQVAALLANDASERGSFSHTLKVVEASCLGMYFGLEDLTMVRSMYARDE